MMRVQFVSALSLCLKGSLQKASRKPLGYSLSLGLLLLGCSQPTAPATPVKQTVVEKQKETLPPLVFASAPKGLVAKARVKDLEALSHLLSGDLEKEIDMKSLVFEYSTLFYPELAEAIVFDNAVEMVAVLGPQPMKLPQWGWSVGVMDQEQVLAALDEKQIAVMERTVGQFYFSLNDAFDCVLARSLGSSPLRIACATTGDAIDELHDYQLRGLPAETLENKEIFIEVNFKPIREVYSGYLPMLRQLASVGAQRNSSGFAPLDAALKKVALAIADDMTELAQELDSLSLSLETKKEAYLFESSIHMQPGNSWLSKNFLDLSKRQTNAPKQLKSLASRSDSFAYFVGLNPSLSQNMFRLIANVAGAYGEKAGASPQQSEEVKASVESLSRLWSASYLAQLFADTNQTDAPALRVYALQTSADELIDMLEGLVNLEKLLPEKSKRAIAQFFLPDVSRLDKDAARKGRVASLEAKAVYQIQLKGAQAEGGITFSELHSRPLNQERKADLSELNSEGLYFALYQKGDFAEVQVAPSIEALTEMKQKLLDSKKDPFNDQEVFEQGVFWASAFSLNSLPLMNAVKDSPGDSGDTQVELIMKVASQEGMLHQSTQVLLPRAFVQTAAHKLKQLEDAAE